MTYIVVMFTIIETPTFEADARKIWTEEERSAFFAWLAASPEIGDPIPVAEGVERFVGRWRVQGSVVECELFTLPS